MGSRDVAGPVSPRLDKTAPTYIAGHRGLVGSAVWRHFATSGFEALVGRTSSELDLRDRDATFAFFDDARPRWWWPPRRSAASWPTRHILPSSFPTTCASN